MMELPGRARGFRPPRLPYCGFGLVVATLFLQRVASAARNPGCIGA